MKFTLKCLLGITFYLSQISATSYKEIENHIRIVQESLKETSETILTTPPDQQTFENTLKPWIQHLRELPQILIELSSSLKANPSKEVSQTLENFLKFLLKIYQNSELEQALTDCAKKISGDVSLNPFKRYLATCLMQEDSDKLIYLAGSSIEKNNSEKELHILNLESCLKSPAPHLAGLILSQDADVICIQDMDTYYAYNLYELLQDTYAHFLYVNPFPTEIFHTEYPVNGLLIVSKLPMENARFNPFKIQKKANEGCLDFILKNNNEPIGHIYLAHLQKDPKTQTSKFLEVVEKMEMDFLHTAEPIPFVLCGKLSLLDDSEEDFCFLSDYGELDLTNAESISLTSIHEVEEKSP